MPPDRDTNVENELRDLGSHIEYPPTPDLASSVKGRLDAEAASRGSRSGPSLWWATAAAALVLVAALSVFSPAVRDLASDAVSLGTGGMAGGAAQGGARGDAASSGEQAPAGRPEVRDEPTVSSAQGAQAGSAAGSAASATALAGEGGPEAASSAGPSGRRAFGEGLGLGERIALREARMRSGTPVLFPRSPQLGKPDEVYDRADAPGFTVLYREAYSRLPGLEDTRIGLLLTQTPGDVGAAYLPGGTVERTGLETVNVNGERGYWVPASGNAPGVARSAGLLAGVLLWERDGQALRLEAGVTKEEAVRIAESVR